MTPTERVALAEKTVTSTQRKLPAVLQSIARELPVVFHDWPSPEILGSEFEPDILGMFVGSPHDAQLDETEQISAHILLFVENIWDYVEEDRDIFIEEIRLTYLHELGHYFGWDEDEVAARGLD